MAIITEDYVSFAVSKLLKEKGFDWRCIGYYVDDEPDDVKYSLLCENNSTWEARCCSAPTLQMAMKWLREVHNIHIVPMIENNGKYICYLYDTKGNNIQGWDRRLSKASYEEACEAVIKYCLKYLI